MQQMIQGELSDRVIRPKLYLRILRKYEGKQLTGAGKLDQWKRDLRLGIVFFLLPSSFWSELGFVHMKLCYIGERIPLRQDTDIGIDSAVWVRILCFSLWILYGEGPLPDRGLPNSIRPMNP